MNPEMDALIKALMSFDHPIVVLVDGGAGTFRAHNRIEYGDAARAMARSFGGEGVELRKTLISLKGPLS